MNLADILQLTSLLQKSDISTPMPGPVQCAYIGIFAVIQKRSFNVLF